MLDDHKYSVNRIVAYTHQSPEHPAVVYGPGGPERTYGLVTDVRRVEDEKPHWEYTIRNSFTGEVCEAAEDRIFHGADRGYLDLYRREGIFWLQPPPESAINHADNRFWRSTLKQFVRTAIPKIRDREKEEERVRREGRSLPLGPGDYIKVRGDLRPETEPYHNMYAKVLSARPSDCAHIIVPKGRQGLAPGKHRILLTYDIQLDSGDQAAIYDVEVKTVYTTLGRTVILNWRAATFLAEAFGDEPPYDVRFEYLNGHIFSRAELEDMPAADLGPLLAHLLFAKGLVTREEFEQKFESLSEAPAAYLVDQILATSRFDAARNRPLTPAEIEESHSEDARLREIID